MNILLVAEEAAGIQALRLLAKSEHRVVAVLTAPQTRGGGTTVEQVARNLALPVLPSERVQDPALAELVRSERVDLLLNVHSLFIIDAAVVSAPRIGSFNLHPGPLPEYAGLSTPSWAIFHGERRHGTTLHWMDPTIDTGPVAYQAAVEIDDSETGLSLSSKCVRAGIPLISRLLADASLGAAAIPATPQDLSRRRYFPRHAPGDGFLNWSDAARQIVDFVRAADYFPFSSPWGPPKTAHDGISIGVTRASITSELTSASPGTIGQVRSEGAWIAASDEWVCVERVMVGGASVDAACVLVSGRRLIDAR